jgi:hypothetical protein
MYFTRIEGEGHINLGLVWLEGAGSSRMGNRPSNRSPRRIRSKGHRAPIEGRNVEDFHNVFDILVAKWKGYRRFESWCWLDRKSLAQHRVRSREITSKPETAPMYGGESVKNLQCIPFYVRPNACQFSD